MKTLEEFITEIHKDVLTKYDFSNARYLGALERVQGIICTKHGEFSQYPAQLRKNGAGCPSCGSEARSNTRRMSTEQYLNLVKDLHKDKGYVYNNLCLKGINSKITVLCPHHGQFIISANHHLYRKQGCPICESENRKTRILNYRHLSSSSKIKNTEVDFFHRCSDAHSGFYAYPEQPYLGAKQKIRIVCPEHGEFTQAAWAHLSGKGCKSCGHRSKGEDALYKFLSDNIKAIRGVRSELDGRKEIDVWIPDLKIGVEYHGLYHHLTSKKGLVHREKWELAQKAGVRLVQIFEDEWLDKQDIVKARLLAFIGKAEKRDARKLNLKVVQWAEAKAFLNSTHIQGCGSSGLSYGLYEGATLIAIATFGKSRSGAMTGAKTEGEYEVLRYASIGVVRGGFTKLLSKFIKTYSPSKIISYCDLRYGTGGLYEKAGFKLEAITPPDYWWVPRGKIRRVSRYATQKHKLAEPSNEFHAFYAPDKTESQICADAGLEKIHGVGSQKWVLQII